MPLSAQRRGPPTPATWAPQRGPTPRPRSASARSGVGAGRGRRTGAGPRRRTARTTPRPSPRPSQQCRPLPAAPSQMPPLPGLCGRRQRPATPSRSRPPGAALRAATPSPAEQTPLTTRHVAGPSRLATTTPSLQSWRHSGCGWSRWGHPRRLPRRRQQRPQPTHGRQTRRPARRGTSMAAARATQSGTRSASRGGPRAGDGPARIPPAPAGPRSRRRPTASRPPRTRCARAGLACPGRCSPSARWRWVSARRSAGCP
mmetsp:Transcript_10071/g.39215  ORF Transcript_10071/g.39215 Transcript_10071/m.39215 type:complete len:258 (+) Transcript_10071:2093-2866(+)